MANEGTHRHLRREKQKRRSTCSQQSEHHSCEPPAALQPVVSLHQEQRYRADLPVVIQTWQISCQYAN